MALLIARTAGTMTFDVGQGEIDLISMAKLDAALGFSEDAPQTLESIVCVPVTYGTQAETGPTPTRIHALANSTGFTSPPHIVIFPVTDTFVLSSGLPLKGNGVALDVGETGNPFTAHVATFYDITLCAGAGMWCDAEGGGTTPITTDVMLYHELSHCFHFVTGTTATGAQEEVNAEIDENDMRDVRGMTHRDVNSHNGGCGGGPPPCCIVASLATASPTSSQVNQLRHFREHVLRRSAIGDDFFQQLHYEYYRFSPEVCTLMGRQAGLKPLIAEYFVTPLLAACKLLQACADNPARPLVPELTRQAGDVRYAELFDPAYLDDIGTVLALADLDQAALAMALRSVGLRVDQGDVQALLQHVNQSTAALPYIGWALLEPLRLWQRAARLHVQGLERELAVRRAYDGWIALMPISDAWAKLPRLSFRIELNALGKYMHTAAVRAVFGTRLRARHCSYGSDIDAWVRAAPH